MTISARNNDERDNVTAHVTLRQIADVVGVSPVTVSLALRGNPRISEKTRARIRVAADQLGYTPDPLLKRLSTYRKDSKSAPVKSVLAWIDQGDGACDCPGIQRCLAGAEEAARSAGYRLDSFDTRGIRPARLAQILNTRCINGMILSPCSTLSLDDFPCDQTATVRIDWNAIHTDTHCVAPAQTSNVIMALRQMHRRGYRRLGYVGASRSPWVFSSNYFCGFQERLDEIEPVVLLLDHEERTEQKARLDTWIRQHRLDAVLVDYEGIPDRIRELEYRIPDDIAVAAVSVPGGDVDAGIDLNLEEVGRVAVQSLETMINANEFGLPDHPRLVMVGGRWVDGRSLPDLNEH